MRMLPTLVAATLTLAAVGCGSPGEEDGPELPARELRAGVVSGDLPAGDPLAAAWEQVRPVGVPLLPQDVAEPRLLEPSVREVRLRALHDGRRIAFLLEWADATVDELADTGRSVDQAALQFPVAGRPGKLPDAMMGEAGGPVAIVLWRASWQRRLEGRGSGVDILYPNRVSDAYPPDAVRDEEGRRRLAALYEPPVAAGNPVTRRTGEPVEDLVAEGFGTVREASGAASTGAGVHRDGTWRVVLARPLDLAPDSPTALRPGGDTSVAVAVWQGGENQRGSRKMRSIWIPLVVAEVEP